MTMKKLGTITALWTLVVGAVLVASASADSKARIVRLSEVQGTVQMDRGTGNGFEKAFLNLPVIEGSKLKTGRDGRAEIEFEDGSVLRIVPNSELNFDHLSLSDDGQRLSTVQVVRGMAYANLKAKKSDQFMLNFARESVALNGPAHFRVDLEGDVAALAVFQGQVPVTGPSGALEVSKKHSATFDLANNDRYEVAKDYDENAYDAWDRQQSEYQNRYASSSGASGINSPYAYGWSDMNYYGSYFNVAGYGTVWQPFSVGMGWSPFQDGGWVWYPGSGYMWVSAYPWGWMPYRYGNWAYAPGFGWVWQPGYWNTWYSVPRVVNPPVRSAIPTPPVKLKQTVMVGAGLSVNPAAGAPRRLTITPGSAGLGVPRGSVKNLQRAVQEAQKESRPIVVKTVTPARVIPTMPASAGSGSRSNSASSSQGTSSVRSSTPVSTPSSTSSSHGSTRPH